jgi:hypothetical protein
MAMNPMTIVNGTANSSPTTVARQSGPFGPPHADARCQTPPSTSPVNAPATDATPTRTFPVQAGCPEYNHPITSQLDGPRYRV